MTKSGSNKKNVTVQIDQALLQHSRHLAVDADKSLSEWIADLISEEVRKTSGRAAAKRRALLVLGSPLKLGGKPLSRDEAHER